MVWTYHHFLDLWNQHDVCFLPLPIFFTTACRYPLETFPPWMHWIRCFMLSQHIALFSIVYCPEVSLGVALCTPVTSDTSNSLFKVQSTGLISGYGYKSLYSGIIEVDKIEPPTLL